jgi:non-ribosomal peptide synthetase component E (peptide arylation enzyme)
MKRFALYLRITFSLSEAGLHPVFCISTNRRTTMPTTHHSAAAERHLQAAHAHEAAAASHSMNDHLRAHEQSKLAHERSIEAHRQTQHIAKEHAEADKNKK